MLNLKVLIRILQPEFTRNFLYFLLLFSFIPILDCILILNLAFLIGNYLFLAILMTLSFLGFFLSRRITGKTQQQIRNDLQSNIMVLNHYYSLPGSLAISFFLIIPGILSSLIGFIFSIPLLRIKSGAFLSRILRIDWKEIHEYLNIID